MSPLSSLARCAAVILAAAATVAAAPAASAAEPEAVLKQFARQRGLALMRKGSLADAGKAADEVRRYLAGLAVKPTGEPIILVYDDPAKVPAGQVRYAALVPVDGTFDVKPPFVFGETPAGEMLVRPAPGSFGEAATRVLAWARANGWEAGAPAILALSSGPVGRAELRVPVSRKR